MSQILENTAVSGEAGGEWRQTKGRKFHIAISKDDEGRYSVIALNLPGVGSCGDTPEEALENFKEAAKDAVESYEEDGETIPWKDATSQDILVGAELRWIIVNV